MKRINQFYRAAFLSVAFAEAALAQSNEVANASTRLKRGEYLVERVAICADCHTVRDWKGTHDRDRWLQGAKLDFKPDRWMPWASFAPGIAGLPSLTNDDLALRYFETGMNAVGKKSSPPMPQYRFEREDALAVVAYLRSLKAAVEK